jgi:hypothetical protein
MELLLVSVIVSTAFCHFCSMNSKNDDENCGSASADLLSNVEEVQDTSNSEIISDNSVCAEGDQSSSSEASAVNVEGIVDQCDLNVKSLVNENSPENTKVRSLRDSEASSDSSEENMQVDESVDAVGNLAITPNNEQPSEEAVSSVDGEPLRHDCMMEDLDSRAVAVTGGENHELSAEVEMVSDDAAKQQNDDAARSLMDCGDTVEKAQTSEQSDRECVVGKNDLTEPVSGCFPDMVSQSPLVANSDSVRLETDALNEANAGIRVDVLPTSGTEETDSESSNASKSIAESAQTIDAEALANANAVPVDGSDAVADHCAKSSNSFRMHVASLNEVNGPTEEMVAHLGSTRVHVADELNVVNGVVKPVDSGVKIGKFTVHISPMLDALRLLKSWHITIELSELFCSYYLWPFRMFLSS